ncbi:PucR family transcriptional regulator ligand-binding domain-containing protein [Fictibacillus enclensis]|uniref:PucR family transcriptional regulator n=1 Tax=Fictibacillus enclensis TaxID=1017270 RepID=UPI0025A0D04C|nr:PucR family transcriptional regulator [Fictibacillus enclensis]MDM5196726.1 PucR family transcriptional regulator ligand-binding domain-containing protein [Fictibacillus enclensis]
MGITVNEMLELEPLKDLRLIAGSQGLHRTIKEVSVLEIPKEYDPFFSGGEFVLTTFHSLKANLAEQVEAVRKLSAAGAAAIGIHPLVTGSKFGKELIEAAEAYDLPIILLPSSMSYSTVISAVLGTILNRQTQILQKSEEINRDLTRLVLRGANVQTIASTLANLIKRPVLVTNEAFEILATGSFSESQRTFLESCLQNPSFLENKQFLKTEKQNVRVHSQKSPQSSRNDGRESSLTPWIVPVGAMNDPLGYIYTWQEEESMHELDFIALSHAGTALALEMDKQHAVEEAGSRYRHNFLVEMLEGNVTSEEELYRRARSIDLNLEHKHVVLMTRVGIEDPFIGLQADQINVKRKIEKRMVAIVRPLMEKYIPKSSIILRGNTAIIFLHFEQKLERDSTRKQSREFAEVLQKALESEFSGTPNSVGIGGFYPSPMDLGKSYREAQHTIDVGGKIFGAGRITAYEELGVYGLLGKAPKMLLSEFATGILKKLNQYDVNHQTELVKTVEAYLDEKESFLAVAKQLYVHPNTVKYRIQKVREVLGFDPFQLPEQRLNFHLALKARRLLS